MKRYLPLLLICTAALIVRLGLLTIVDFPGVADPNHYFNMAVRVVEGHGLTIDYVWQYNVPPDDIVHPEEHWMPLTALIAAVPMSLFGISVRAAVLPSIAAGVLLPALVYLAARQWKLSHAAALMSAAGAAFLPEFMLNSLRTDTTIFAAVFVTGALAAFHHGLKHGSAWAYGLCGVLTGLAYLTRTDGALILPLVPAVIIVMALVRRHADTAFRPRWSPLVVVGFVLAAAPYWVYNLNATGMIGSPETSDMFFFTDHNDHYAYGRTFTLQTMLEAQTFGQILGKRIFEFAAGIRMATTTLDLFAVPVIGGLILLVVRRDRPRLIAALPVVLLIIGAFIAYAVFIPYKAQAGSLKKAWLMALPALLPAAGYALEQVIAQPRLRYGALALILGLTAANGIELVRADLRFAAAYRSTVEAAVAVLQTLPDVNADGDRRVMTQDPYMLRYAGVRSVMFPFEDRDLVYEIALRYGIDYLLMPPARPSLDALYLRTETDPRFVFAADVPGTTYVLYRVERDP